MATITIDDITYDLDTLTASAEAQSISIQFVDRELARLQALAATSQTACMAYSEALGEALLKS